MKKLLSLALALIMVISFAVSAYAADGTDYVRVLDYIDGLSDEETEVLSKRTRKLYENYGYDCFCMLTEAAEDNSAYSYNIYSQLVQFTGRHDCILFIISADNGVYDITAYGFATEIFTDDVEAETEETVSSYIDSGDYYGAFGKFITVCDEYFEDSDSQSPYTETVAVNDSRENTENSYTSKSSKSGRNITGTVITAVIGSIIVGLIAGFAVCSIYKSQMNNTGIKTEARDYMNGNLNLTENSETLIKKKVTKRKLETQQPPQPPQQPPRQ